MKALILAAGIGSRIEKYTNGKPKSLLHVQGKSIIKHQISSLRKNGLEFKDIIIVTGFKAEEIEREVGKKITYIHNQDYRTTNSLYSMWLARNENYSDGMILLNADVIFNEKILEGILNISGNVVAVDFRKDLNDNEMNVIVNSQNNITKISKEIKANSASGESVQIAKFTGNSCNTIFSKTNELIESNNKDKFPAYVFKYVIAEEDVVAYDIGNLDWIEIDYPIDYEEALKKKWY